MGWTGQPAVWERPDGKTELIFGAYDRALHFVDAETGSTWNVLGQATDGPLVGAELEAVAHVDTFWFAWAAFRPDTEIIES